MARLVQFRTNAQRKAAARRELKKYADKKVDRYEIMGTAESFGWTDPGYTEKLDKTVDRAVTYLAKIAEVTVKKNPRRKTRQKPRYTVAKPSRARGTIRNNPTDRSMRKAVRLYSDFTGHNPTYLDDWDVDVPDTALQVGHVTGILYKTKMDGKMQEFMHEFTGRSRPILAASADGHQLLLLGGDYKFTERGIVDGSYSIGR